MSVHQSNLQQSAILLLNRLKIDREIAAFFASDYETLDCLEHWSRSNSPIAEPAQRLLKQVKKMKYENLYDPFDRMKLSIRSRSISPFEKNFQDSGFDENTVTSPNYSENSPNYRYGMEYMEGGMVGYGQKYSPGTPGSTFVNMAQPYSIPKMDDYPLASVFCSNSDGQSDEMAHVSFTYHGEMSQKNSPLLMQFSD
ncbi:unnamed protein product [Bursaphelenchus okinawaensis]|uniref:Uncharacterized protein n=1 Tax=Bursaphelenchus okinawaensis TaxID=465554 RepID=A0A811LH67_9BILA|nr:unnamed protein product [Bursaphelenchus okinawaensis]CAG9123742.1 unnamed protein product [Bursaphelenchus okinawaensis]